MVTTSVSVRLASIRRSFGDFTALHNVDLDIAAGDFVSLLGPSGCGKTTTLRLIAGFDYPTQGRIFIGNTDVTDLPPNRRKLGMVFQNYALFPHMTVSQNIGFGLRMAGVEKTEVAKRVSRILDVIHMGRFAERLPSQLSGGQQQRVAIARSLVMEPSVLLLDEPMAALDKNLRHSMQNELRQMQREFGITTILVTHDQEEALTMSDSVVVMQDGYVRQIGTPEEVYNRPESIFVANFLGISNDFKARVSGAFPDGRLKVEIILSDSRSLSTVARAKSLDGDVILSVRPERISLRDASTATSEIEADTVAIPGRIESHMFRGICHEYTVSIYGTTMLVSAYEQAQAGDMKPNWTVGAEVLVTWPATTHNIFSSNVEPSRARP